MSLPYAHTYTSDWKWMPDVQKYWKISLVCHKYIVCPQIIQNDGEVGSIDLVICNKLLKSKGYVYCWELVVFISIYILIFPLAW